MLRDVRGICRIDARESLETRPLTRRTIPSICTFDNTYRIVLAYPIPGIPKLPILTTLID